MKYPSVSYQDYLKIDQLLSSQRPLSQEYGKPAHDEMLFIIVHQTYELWFRQILFDLDSILKVFDSPQVPEVEMGKAVHRLERIIDIQNHINGQIDILETMTPLDFLDFRDMLFPASGFQSFQWRMLECKLGLKTDIRIKLNESPFYSALTAEQQVEIKAVLGKPSLFDVVESWLERTPFLRNENFDFWETYRSAVFKMLEHDAVLVQGDSRLGPAEKQKNLENLSRSRESFEAFFDADKYKGLQDSGYFRLSQGALQAALFIQVYRDLPALQLPFRLLDGLMNLDEKLTEWRSRHAQMAYRMLGKKIGTGGSSGHDYLRAAADKHKIFTDFFNLTTFLIPRSSLPDLPEELKKKMNFHF